MKNIVTTIVIGIALAVFTLTGCQSKTVSPLTPAEKADSVNAG